MTATVQETTTHLSSKRPFSRKDHETLFPTLCTFVLWIVCLVVGTAGLLLPYPRSHPPKKEAPPLLAETLHVELTSDPLPPPDIQPVAQLSQPPPLMEMPLPSQAPPMIAVAEPSPAVAFAVPVEGLTRVVPVKEASYVKPAPAVTPVVSSPAPQPLTFGQGEGKQPAPEYPRRASAEGQEGTVVVRFTVAENGRVMAAEASSPCPWSLLNESALRTVRERWRFNPGMIRLYEVAIRFQLRK